MSNSDDDVPSFVLLMDYFIRKMCAASRIPKHVPTFNGRDQILKLPYGHKGRFVEVMQMKNECFFRLCGLLLENGLQQTQSITVQEQLMIFLTVVEYSNSS